MNYVIDRTSPTPAYIQLYRELRSDLVSGAIPYGAKLPSKRTLAEELGFQAVFTCREKINTVSPDDPDALMDKYVKAGARYSFTISGVRSP